METRSECELEEREKLIRECLKWEIELKNLKKEWRVKKEKNLKVKQHNKLLVNKLVMLKRRNLKNEHWQVIEVKECRLVIEVKECRVVIKNAENQTNELKMSSQKANKNNSVSSNKRFYCQHPGCEKYFDSKSSLRGHMNVHKKKFQCQTCQKCCHSHSHLQLHLRTHTGERPFVCNWVGCDKRFKDKFALKQHIIYSHSDEKLFKCDKDNCGKSFKSKGGLKMHLKNHSSLRSFHCQVQGCDSRFKTKSDLTRHVKQVHSDIRNFRCQFENCSKAFKYQNDLKNHLKYIHSTLRPFQCQVTGCDKRSKTKADLKKHVKNVH